MILALPIFLLPGDGFWPSAAGRALIRRTLSLPQAVRDVAECVVLSNDEETLATAHEAGHECIWLDGPAGGPPQQAWGGGWISEVTRVLQALGERQGPVAVINHRNPHVDAGLISRAARTFAGGVLVSVALSRDHPCQLTSVHGVEGLRAAHLLDTRCAPDALPAAGTLLRTRPCRIPLGTLAHMGLEHSSGLRGDLSFLELRMPVLEGLPPAGLALVGGAIREDSLDKDFLIFADPSTGDALFRFGTLAQGTLLEVYPFGESAFRPRVRIEVTGGVAALRHCDLDSLSGLLCLELSEHRANPGPAPLCIGRFPSNQFWEHGPAGCTNLKTGATILGRQHFPEVYELCPALCILNPATGVDLELMLASGRCQGLPIPWEQNLDIQSPVDYACYRATLALAPQRGGPRHDG